MATYNVNTFNFDLSTDAAYQALWGAVDTQIRGLGGWTYVSQTGDSDPAATATGANGTYPSWRVYSTTVGAQTWYLRLDYGHNANGPTFKYQYGSTVNGSGVLGGQTSTQQTPVMGGAVGTNKSVYIAQASGRFALRLVMNNSGSSEIWVSIHSYVDTSGVNAATGMQWYGAFPTGTTLQCQPVPISGTVPAVFGAIPVNALNNTDTTIGTHVMTHHPFLWDESGGLNVNAAVAIMGGSNCTTNFTATAPLYGSTRTFLATIFTHTAFANLRTLILWE